MSIKTFSPFQIVIESRIITQSDKFVSNLITELKTLSIKFDEFVQGI